MSAQPKVSKSKPAVNKLTKPVVDDDHEFDDFIDDDEHDGETDEEAEYATGEEEEEEEEEDDDEEEEDEQAETPQEEDEENLDELKREALATIGEPEKAFGIADDGNGLRRSRRSRKVPVTYIEQFWGEEEQKLLRKDVSDADFKQYLENDNDDDCEILSEEEAEDEDEDDEDDEEEDEDLASPAAKRAKK